MGDDLGIDRIGEEGLPCSGVSPQSQPLVSGGLIVFENLDAVFTIDIMAYDIATSTLYRLTSDPGDEFPDDVAAHADGTATVVLEVEAGGRFQVQTISFNRTIGALAGLEETIGDLGLDPGMSNSLTSKVENAMTKVSEGELGAACNLLDSFINQCEAQRNKKLTAAQADELIAAAQAVQASIGCP